MRKVASFIVEKRIAIIILFVLLGACSLLTSGFVKIENDLYSFLPESTETRQAIKAMDGEFKTLATANVMIENVSDNVAKTICDDLSTIEGVNSVAFEGTEADYVDGNALLTVTFDGEVRDEISLKAMDEVREHVKNYDTYINTQVGTDFASTLGACMVVIGIIVVVIMIALLLLTSRSFAEVPVLLLTFGMAALLQFGTNFIFNKISYVSNAVTLILQLALAIDYAVILCNRFSEEKTRHEPYEAIVEALSKAIPEIAASSLTTIGGLIAMTFMQFTLGGDLGKVLIKSILFSMLSVFLFMPGLLLMFNGLIERTSHRRFIPKIDGVGMYAWASRKIVPPVFIAFVLVAFFLAMKCPFLYNYYDAMPVNRDDNQIAREVINDTFGYRNMLALVVPTGDYDTEAQMLSEVADIEHVTQVKSIASTVVGEGLRLVDEIGISDFMKIADLDRMSAEALFAYYGAKTGDYDEVKNDLSNYKIRILDLFLFLHDVVESGDETIAISQDNKDLVMSLYDQLTSAKKQLQGVHYSRMLVYCDTPIQSEESYEVIAQIHKIADPYYGGDVYVAGDATCARDLGETYVKDNLMVSIMSIVLVVLVILFTFRNVGLPVLLIMVIQGSIWINFSFPTIFNNELFFVGYLIVSAIQMGANIDYAIVISNRYISLRQNHSKRESIIAALNGGLPTLVTSGSILAVAGLLIGYMTNEATISTIGIALGRGTILSLLLVLFVLPQILLWGDGFIGKTRFGKKERSPRERRFTNDFEDVAIRRGQPAEYDYYEYEEYSEAQETEE